MPGLMRESTESFIVALVCTLVTVMQLLVLATNGVEVLGLAVVLGAGASALVSFRAWRRELARKKAE